MMPGKKVKIPSFARWIASRFIPKFYQEELLGDLKELYEERLNSSGAFTAQMMYWIDALHLIIGFSSIRKMKTQNNNYMIRNMLKIAWRNAVRQKQPAILNILGLTIGIVTVLVIGVYVFHESNYDDFHEKSDRIYRVNQPDIWGDWDEVSSSTGPNVAIALREEAPEFEEITRLMSQGNQIVNIKNENAKDLSFKESNFFVAEENFFEVFTFEFYEGDRLTALENPNSIVMTQESAERYFGNDKPLSDAIGEQVEIKQWDGSWKSYQITGVIANVPTQSHLQFDMLASLSSYNEQMKRDDWKWIWTAFSTYGLVSKGVDVQNLTEKIQKVPPKWAASTTERIFNQSFDEFTASNQWKLELQPLRDIYLSEGSPIHRFGPVGNPLYIKIFSFIGLLVLILSCINFMNLSTARSTKRAKEVGVRKVLGSNKRALIYQFIVESILFVLVSTVIALFLSQSGIVLFNNIADLKLSMRPYLMSPVFYLVVLAFVLLLGIFAGSYPAIYLSSFKPIESLKGKLNQNYKGIGIRNGLVIVQFSISISLIIFSVFVKKQLDYASTIDVGFAKENVLQIHNIEQLGFNTDHFKEQLLLNPAITMVGKSFGIPPYIWSGDRYKSKEPDSKVVQLSNLRTEEDYIDLLGLEFLAGRNFQKDQPRDKYKVVLNESAVRALGWGSVSKFDNDTIVGKLLKIASGDENDFEVIGVVKDFNFNSLKEGIKPLVMIHQLNDQVWDYGAGLSYYSLKLNSQSVNSSESLQSQIDFVQERLSLIDPTIPFEYSFLDQGFEMSFRSEQRMSLILTIFTAMAMVIACVGLFGLSAFSAELRIKEMGIRKVLGANSAQITILFSKNFLKLILISILIASPIAYYFVNFWLQDFAYKTEVTALPFVLTAFSAILISLFTISYQSLKTAWHDPVEFLKDE